MADNPSQPQTADPNAPAPVEQNAETQAAPTSGEQSANAESVTSENSAEQQANGGSSTETAVTSDAEAESTEAENEETESSDANGEKAEDDSASSTPSTEGANPASNDAATSTPEEANIPGGAHSATGAPPPPPDSKSAQTPPSGVSTNKKKILKFIIPIIVVMILGGIGGGVSYYLGFWGKKPVESVNIAQAQNQSEATESASIEPELITPDCVSGYKPYVNKLFSICYPITMDIKQHPATDSAVAVTEFIFEDAVETLKVLTNYKDNLNKFDCASSKVVKVATYSAHRYQVKDPNPKGGCAATINEYASLVSVGNDKPIFYIGLTRKEGSYQSDNGAYAAIEQSFRINQP